MEDIFFKEAQDAMELLYDFVMESYENYSQPRDYGNGVMMPMVEIHTLSLIAANPGIVVTDVAKMWNRTLSAASQNVNKLVKKGLVTKTKEPGNNKAVHLYPTEEGNLLAKKHQEYDKKVIEGNVRTLLENHSIEELRTVIRVLKTGVRMTANEET